MLKDRELPIIAFVWRGQEISSSVVEAARRTGTRAVFDLCAVDPDSVAASLLKADVGGDAVDIKVLPESLFDPRFENLLEDTGLTRAWIELHPALLERDPAAYLDRMVELSEKVTCFPVVADLDLIYHILLHYPRLENLAIKGSEAAGFVSSENLFTLYQDVSSRASAREHRTGIVVWGGVAAPEAAAAFLSVGARGIVFESLHWLTDLASASGQVREKIEKLRPEHTDIAGLNLGAPCRLFNRGNSKAVKELKELAGSLCGAEITDDYRRSFAEKIIGSAIHPLDSGFSRDELVPLGVEATFCGSFVRRFGGKTEEAIDRFIRKVEILCSGAGEKERSFVNSSTAGEMETVYPFLQGAMSWISDIPEFALKVADAGGLPTIALGMMNEDALERQLAHLKEAMGDKAYAVNVITLQENPFKDVHMAWIRRAKPKFAVIAAGEPSHARELLDAGIEVIYIAPNEELLRLAFEAGIRYVICEGNEAGGHVGEHSTLTIAQIVLDLKDRDPGLFEGRRVILAGGICNRQTAFMAAMLGADAVQMGTSYLATKEIVETGALTPLYQRMIIASQPGSTVVTGESAGLRVRSLHTPKTEAICSLERDFAAGSELASSFRQKIEQLAAGSLFTASRGLDKPDGVPLDEQSCIDQGQFMSGACAGVLNRVTTVAELHHELAESALGEGLPYMGPFREARTRAGAQEAVLSRVAVGSAQRAYRSREKERIAVTGMSAVNSLGNSPEEIWAASMGLKSGIVEVPPSKWDHSMFFDPRPRVSEKTYCKVGAFQKMDVSRKDLGIPPQDFRTMTNSTKITMWLAQQAIQQSGILESDIPRERIAVLISQNSGEAAATLQDVIIRGASSKLVDSVKRALPLTAESERAVEEAVKSGRIAIDDTTLLGRLNCAAAGFICNKYGFNGPSFAVSAACATALVALYSAYQMIRNGIIDAAIIGGAEENLTPMHFLEFSALGALAGLSGAERLPQEASRPFDNDRDGMVLGEGGGMIVIERESVARGRGARAYAYITAMGASNNHLGMVESSKVTQEIAIGASFDDALYGPDQVDLVECHATSTRQGDVEEVHALKRFFNSDKPTVLTSFKSQIGHTLGASGVISLIRGVMAMNAKAYPATLNYRTPDPEIDLEGMGFAVLSESTDWSLRNGGVRRLEVNAFGFGGSNYVVQVEESAESADQVMVSLPDRAENQEPETTGIAPPDGIAFFRTEINGRRHRMAVVAQDEEQALSVLKKVEPVTNGGGVPAKRIRALRRHGIHLGSEELPAAPLAFVFPGQGSHYAGMSHQLYQTFPVIREWMDRIAEVADFDLLRLLFFDQEEDLQKTRWQQPALFTMEYAMVQYLYSMGVRPVAMAGHSLGELTALCLAGVYTVEDGFRIVNKRAICMDKACAINADPGIMMAVDAPLDYLERALPDRREKIYITNVNSPQQVVLGGDTRAVTAFGEELKQQGYRRTRLRVSMAFHSPIMACIRDELQEFISTVEFHPPKIPVISNTTMKPFPSDTTEIKRIVMAHLESPVHWMQNVSTLWNDFGVRLFVEVGPRDILSNLITDTANEAQCVQTCLPSVEPLIYRTAVAELYARGHLDVRARTKFVQFPGQEKVDKAAEAKRPSPTASTALPAVPQTRIEAILQREINAFFLESFGRFLKPNILAAIRREVDPRFSEQKLDELLRKTFPTPAAQPSIAATGAVPAPALPDYSIRSEASASEVPSVHEDDITEQVIRIIMDATGYERDEIEPEMDLREDLSIRSSRLPVIMDAMESHFGIKIELEEFMDVRTIKDTAETMAKIMARKRRATGGPAPGSVDPAAIYAPRETSDVGAPKESLKRILFREAPSDEGNLQPVELEPTDSVTVLSAYGGTGLRREVANLLRRDYGVIPHLWSFMKANEEFDDVGEDGFDLRTLQCAAMAAEELSGIESLAGVVFIVDPVYESQSPSMEDISRVLRGFFCVLKTFLESPAKKFAILIHKTDHPEGPGKVLAEGVLGMFMTLAHEFSSVQFRTIRVDSENDLRVALRGALDRSRKPVELIYRDGEAFTMEGRVVPWRFGEGNGVELRRGDVVVVSGGGQGITFHLAKTLAHFGCRLVLLGRTILDGDADHTALLKEEENPEEAVVRTFKDREPGIPAEELEHRKGGTLKALEIAGNIAELRELGADAAYYPCDVADSGRTESVMAEILERYGRIDGIIHGAGFLRDSFIKHMNSEDFAAVANVKFIGAWNLFNAARDADLKFFVCLSSAAAIQGNPGQVNYSAGNRIMSALLSYLRHNNDSLFCKALMLPPIEGVGMAENQDIQALMRRMNAAYVHIEELAALFSREMRMGSPDETWVMFMRALPDLATSRLNTVEEPAGPGHVRAGVVDFSSHSFPMIDSVKEADLETAELKAVRTFSQRKDLWLPDHKPFKFLKHPLVSAIMALETFMESARLLFPYLTACAIRDAEFLDIISCPAGLEREAEILCRKVFADSRETVCEVSLAAREVSPSGRPMGRTHPHYTAKVLLDSGSGFNLEDPPGFPVTDEQLDSRPMDHSEVLTWYRKRTDMQGRYRLMEDFDGSGPAVVRGRAVYRQIEDFEAPLQTHYQYSPYLLEALMQAANFYVIMRNQHEKRSMIPYKIGEALFVRKCDNGETVTVEGRVHQENDEGLVWNARAVDGQGRTIMVVREMVMRWFTE